MKKKFSLILILVLLVAGCDGKKAADPIQPLTKVTMDPQREIQYEATRQAWAAMNPVPLPNTPNAGEKSGSAAEQTVQAATEAPQGFYTLQAGESPKCIARRMDVDYLKLYSINNISFENESSIQPGTALIIPQNSTWNPNHGPRASAEHPTNYTVQAGDTLFSIACIYGDVSPESIALENGITASNQVIPGQSLKIP